MARACALLIVAAAAREYAAQDPVTVYFNKVVPSNNPQEVHTYLDLPLCLGESEVSAEPYALTLGEALQGDSMVESRLRVRFLQEVKQGRMCTTELTPSEVLRLHSALRSQYWLQLYIDDLPVWGPLGKVSSTDPEKYYIYTHMSLLLHYNEGRIVQVQYQPLDLLEIESPDEALYEQIVTLYYSVSWVKSTLPYEDRMNVYRDVQLMESRVHWLATANSVIIMLLMCGLVGLVLSRALSKDHSTRTDQVIDTMGAIITESPGWKLIAGEVFRAPTFLLLFTACVGTGFQLLTVAGVTLVLGCVFPICWRRGLTVTLPFILYCLAALVGGIKSGSTYLQHKGKSWVKCMIVCHLFLPTLYLLAALPQFVLSLLSGTLPIPRLLEAAVIFTMLATPIHAEGTILGRKYWGDAKYPYQISIVKQPILRQKNWYQRPLYLALVGGVLPFLCVVGEVYLLMNCWWQGKVYYTYGFALATFLILVVTESCVSIISTYLFLCSEDYRWQWVSYLSSASTSLYFLLYSLYYFAFHTSLTGLPQLAAYFTSTGNYQAVAGALVTFFVCGAVGHCAAACFVRTIYTRVKHE